LPARYDGIPEIESLKKHEPLLWINPNRRPAAEALRDLPLQMSDILDAEARLARFAPLLAELFEEIRAEGGTIESELLTVRRLREELRSRFGADISGALWLKADHALPVAGSVKARGGIYEVLHFAEKLALAHGLIAQGEPYTELLAPRARELFGGHTLYVASTGNLGLSIGVMGSALGFQVCVHMSSDAKEWKKERLRRRGVRVVEHGRDVTAAGRAAREAAAESDRAYFVDDERSPLLFLGYSVAALRLKEQLQSAGIVVDAAHPLFVYLPCGLGGAPCGIMFGLKHVFGDAAHCFLAEPVDAPCLLLGMLTGFQEHTSVYDIGLRNRTQADGLAVAVPSRLVGPYALSLASGCLTVEDDDLFRFVYLLDAAEDLHVEPSAAAGFAGPILMSRAEQGRRYLETDGVAADAVTHILWTTGGLFVPPAEYRGFVQRGAALCGT